MTRRRLAGRGTPPAVAALSVLIALFFALPIIGLVARTPWRDAWSILGAAQTRAALRLSLSTSLATTTVAVLFGVPLAWFLARSTWPGRTFIRALCTLPMVLPPVVGGVALLTALGRRGLAGRLLYDGFGLQIPFTTAAVVIAQTFVSMPFFVLTVEAALRQVDPRREEMARVLGAGRTQTFVRVTLPAVRPALAAGAVLCWARALGEFGATIVFAGSTAGRTTLPMAAFVALGNNPGEAYVLSLLLVAVALAVLIGLRSRWLGATNLGVVSSPRSRQSADVAPSARSPQSADSASGQRNESE